MPAIQCPTQQELSDFDVGRIAVKRCEEISQHLDQCADCAALLESLDENHDELLDRLRDDVPVEIVKDDSELRELVHRAAGLHDTSIKATCDTSPGKTEPAPEAPG